MQNTEGFDALIGANQGCFAAFAAVYDCAVPLIAAVQGFCVGGGIGLVGNADIVIASDDATSGSPRWTAAPWARRRTWPGWCPSTRCGRWSTPAPPPPRPSSTPSAPCSEVVPRDELRGAALEVAADIAAKSPTVIRAAKESLNGIDLWDVKRSYRFEQGFTFELNLSGVSDELRDAFVDKRDADTSR